jgi:hypothetical protein
MAGLIEQTIGGIPEAVTRIGDRAYKDQTEMTSVVPFDMRPRDMRQPASTMALIPAAITKIGVSAFEG